MKIPFDKRRNVFIHDFDGVHYCFENHPNYPQFYLDCATHAITKSLDHPFTNQEIEKIYRESYQNHGAPFMGFLRYAQEQGLDEKEFIMAYDRLFHEHAISNIYHGAPEWLRPCNQTRQLFSQLNGYVQHGILSQANIDLWVRPILGVLGTLDYFKPQSMLGFKEVGGHLKASSPVPIQMAMDSFGVSSNRVAFIEDSHRNLKTAKEHYPDICTVLISSQRQDFDYVDVQVGSLLEFKQMALSAFLPNLHQVPRFG